MNGDETLAPAGRLRYAYNTNGLREHDGPSAVRLLASLGYDAIELSLLAQHYDPLRGASEQLAGIEDALRETGLGVVVGAGVPLALSDERFEPSLFHPDPDGRALRLRFLRASVQTAARLGSTCLVFCTGALRPDVERGQAVAWLDEGLRALCQEGTEWGVRIALEPEPGHLIETMADYWALAERVGPELGLTLDVGHIVCTEAESPEEVIGQAVASSRLAHVQIEDIRDRTHHHLPFGEGQMVFPPILRAFLSGGYQGYLGVELSRHSHEAEARAPESLAFLRAAEAACG
ncbi:MAG: sugar phosphate isomerase/epimerase [Chloroflexi bacterium]|nr:sugar phosphate isomerase/epimerase [Chloroflexota bacterium]